MEIDDFAAIADKQHAFLCDVASIDGGILDQPPSQWKPRGKRRGWTRADLRRYEAFMDLTPIHLRPNHASYRQPKSRVYTALRQFDFLTPMVEASNRALDECKRHPELTELAPVILRLFAAHKEWMEWLISGEPSDIDTRWNAVRRELWWLAQNHGLLRPDYKKQEWDRWRNLCTTAKRRELLDIFWIAKHPLSRAEVDPDSGTGFRRVVGEINKLAATAKPPIPWEIRADEKTQKWSKNWFGR